MQSAAERLVFFLLGVMTSRPKVFWVFLNYVEKSFMTAGQKRHETTAKHMNLT